MRAILGSFEEEAQKPGKAFHELVRRRRRMMGLPLPAEERVAPFRSSLSASLPALDLLIDQEVDATFSDGEHAAAGNQGGKQSSQAGEAGVDGDAGRPLQARVLALLRTERRLVELEQAIQEAPKTGRKAKRVQHELGEAYEHELRTHAALRASRHEWE